MTIRSIIHRLTQRRSKGPMDHRLALLESLPTHGICAEIGVWKGDFSARILEVTCPDKLHLIDPYQFQTQFGKRLYGGKVAQSQADMDVIYAQTVDRFSQATEVMFHRMFSDDAAREFSDAYFDWVYIDGNHYYDYVLADLRAYFPKVRKGGFVTGDDVHWTSPELEGDKPVKRALEMFMKENAESIHEVRFFGSQFMIRKH